MQLRLLVALFLCIGSVVAQEYAFGTYHRLFSAQSLWNSRPINPKFGTGTINLTSNPTWAPVIAGGAYSTGVFLAKASDPPLTIYPAAGKTGVYDADTFENYPNITIPRWPGDAIPASGGDGHCDIVDEATGIIHSFWILRQVNGRWTAVQYGWAPLKGLGFGDPAHFYTGARAAGVASSGGLIRKHEVNDNKPIFNHALAMSLDYSGLSKNPTYIYPATAADGDAATANSGAIPEGGLVMLPPTYNTSTIRSLPLRKVADTLKVYGAYVVDRNYKTPYVIYVENNSTWKMTNLSWDNTLVSDMQKIRAALRLVISADRYVDGNGATLVAPTNVNLLSLRGPSSWYRQSGDAVVKFDTWTQSLVYQGANTKNTTHINQAKLGYNRVSWGSLQGGKTYRFAVKASGGPQLKIVIYANGAQAFNSGFLGAGQSVTFVWPSAAGAYIDISAFKPISAVKGGSVGASITVV